MWGEEGCGADSPGLSDLGLLSVPREGGGWNEEAGGGASGPFLPSFPSAFGFFLHMHGIAQWEHQIPQNHLPLLSHELSF